MDAILGNKGRENPNTKFKTGMKSAAEMLTENKEKHIPRSVHRFSKLSQYYNANSHKTSRLVNSTQWALILSLEECNGSTHFVIKRLERMLEDISAR